MVAPVWSEAFTDGNDVLFPKREVFFAIWTCLNDCYSLAGASAVCRRIPSHDRRFDAEAANPDIHEPSASGDVPDSGVAHDSDNLTHGTPGTIVTVG